MSFILLRILKLLSKFTPYLIHPQGDIYPSCFTLVEGQGELEEHFLQMWVHGFLVCKLDGHTFLTPVGSDTHSHTKYHGIPIVTTRTQSRLRRLDPLEPTGITSSIHEPPHGIRGHGTIINTDTDSVEMRMWRPYDEGENDTHPTLMTPISTQTPTPTPTPYTTSASSSCQSIPHASNHCCSSIDPAR